MVRTEPDDEAGGVQRGALAALSLAALLASLGTSIANVALPTFALAFGASFQAVQWILLAYLLAVTLLVVGAGRLGDLVGRRRLLLGGIGLFALASLLCGMAPGLWTLVAARAVQGLGAAIMMALSLALVGTAMSKARIGAAMGLLGTVSALGTALGPPLGGLLIAGPGWRALFFLNVPLALLALVLAKRHLPADPPRTTAGAARFDLAGALLLAAILACYALAMTIGRGTFGPVNSALLAASALGAGLFVLVQSRAASPLVPPGMLRDRALAANLATSLLVSTVMMASLVVGPFHLSLALGLGPVSIGLVLSAGPLAAAFAGLPAGRLVDRFGAQMAILAGLAVMAAGAVALCALPASLGLGAYVAPLLLLTTGYSLFQTANNSAAMRVAGPDRSGLVSGLLGLARNLGLITGASFMGAVFVAASGTSDMASAAPRDVAQGTSLTFGLAAILILAAGAIALSRSRGSFAAVRRAS